MSKVLKSWINKEISDNFSKDKNSKKFQEMHARYLKVTTENINDFDALWVYYNCTGRGNTDKLLAYALRQ